MENASIHHGRIYMEVAWHQHDLIALVKMKPGKQWHPEQKRWSLPDTVDNRAWAGVPLAPAPIADYIVSPPICPFRPATPLAKGSNDGALSMPHTAPSTHTTPQESGIARTCWLENGHIYYIIPFSETWSCLHHR